MKMPSRVAQMQNSHIDDVVRLELQANANPLSASVLLNELKSPTHLLLVACVPSEIHPGTEKAVGYTGGQVVADELHIHSLVVEEKFRRHGLGLKLISNLIDSAIDRGSKSATLEVRVGNSGAIALYEKLGFVTEGQRPHYYADNGEDARIMWLRALEKVLN